MRSVFNFFGSETSNKTETKEKNYTPILLQEFLAGGKESLPSDKAKRKAVLAAAKEEYLAKSPQEKGEIFARWLSQLEPDKRQEFVDKLKLGEEGIAVEELKKPAPGSSFSLTGVSAVIASLASHFAIAAGDPNIGTRRPSSSPTISPSASPTISPSAMMTFMPTSEATANATANMTAFLTDFFSAEPTSQPTAFQSNETHNETHKSISAETPYAIWVAAGVALLVCCGFCIGCCYQEEKAKPFARPSARPLTDAERKDLYERI